MLVSLGLVKGFLNVSSSDTSQDSWLTNLMTAADATVKSYLGQNIEPANYLEFYEGTGTRFLPLRQRPVTAINNLWVDFNANYGQNPAGAFGTDTLLTQGSDYVLDYDAGGTNSRSGLVVRINTVWSQVGRTYYPGKMTAEIGPAFGSIKVDYNAGYATIPIDIQYACCYLVAFMRRTIKIGGEIHSERIGDYAYELKTLRIPQHPEIGTARQLLSRYKEFAMGGTP